MNPGFNPKEDIRKFSMDSEPSIIENIQRPNFKCSKNGCHHKFHLDTNESIIRCPECGYRILDKLRTRNYITYKTT